MIRDETGIQNLPPDNLNIKVTHMKQCEGDLPVDGNPN